MNPICKICGAPVTRFIKSTDSWWKWCSNKCMGQDPEILAKKKQANIKKFGVEHPMHLESVKKKLKQTFQEKYGVDNPSKSKKVRQKMQQTFQEKYGVDNPSKNSEIIKKIKNSALKRYSNSKEEIVDKRRKTYLDSIGVTSNKHLHISSDSIKLMKDIEWLKDQHFNQKKSFQQIANELGISPTPILTFFSNNGLEINRFSFSKGEKEVRNYISSVITDEILFNDRTVLNSKELDIYIPSKKIAIEFNGIFWHSETHGKYKTYHLEKTSDCESKGIRLIQLYDSEWNDPIKNLIIKSKLNHILGLSKKIYARKCEIRSVSSQDSTEFLNKNHIQGSCGSKIRLGLYYKNKLVGLATFGIPRYNRKYDLELLRYCCIIDHTIVGGLSKIISVVKREQYGKSLISYADRRWSSNNDSNLYISTGFNFDHASDPNYKYFNIQHSKCILQSRTTFQKHKLKNLLKNFDPKLSEYDNMLNNGYDRIWDCGNLVYTINLERQK